MTWKGGEEKKNRAWVRGPLPLMAAVRLGA